MAYVIRTDKLSPPHYWAGVTPGNVGMCQAITPVIFDAWYFDDEAEAADLIKKIGGEDDWTVSKVRSGAAAALRERG